VAFRGIHTKLAELAVGDNQSAQSPQAVKGLVAVLLSLLLVDWGVGGRNGLGVKLLGLPNEVLEQVAVVLGQQQVLRMFHNLVDIGNKPSSLG
jgi:hypothetical protein